MLSRTPPTAVDIRLLFLVYIAGGNEALIEVGLHAKQRRKSREYRVEAAATTQADRIVRSTDLQAEDALAFYFTGTSLRDLQKPFRAKLCPLYETSILGVRTKRLSSLLEC
jgi:hypothetical protein